MERFPLDREDKIWLHKGRWNQNTSLSNRLQSVVDQVDQLGLLGKDEEKQNQPVK